MLLEVGGGERLHALLPAGETLMPDGEVKVSMRPRSAIYFDSEGWRITESHDAPEAETERRGADVG